MPHTVRVRFRVTVMVKVRVMVGVVVVVGVGVVVGRPGRVVVSYDFDFDCGVLALGR